MIALNGVVTLKILSSGKEKRFDSIEKMLSYYTEYGQPFAIVENQLIRGEVVIGIFSAE